MTDLSVLRGDVVVGRLSAGSAGAAVFRYHPAYLAAGEPRPISRSLPLSPAPTLTSWFGGLLPGAPVRGHLAHRLGVTEHNDLALLAGAAGDCAGALSLAPVDDDPAARPAHALRPRREPLPWPELSAAVSMEPRVPLLALMLDEQDLRLCLGGSQDKLPVCVSPVGDLSLPAGGAASTHIVKAAPAARPDLVGNELLCLRLAAAVGLPVVEAHLAPTDVPLLVMRRYDRRTDVAGGGVVPWHQEDLAQALGLPTTARYEPEGGPSLAAMFQLVSRVSERALADRQTLLDWVVFNLLIGNADGHAANLSLLDGDPDRASGCRLAPLRDLTCTAISPGWTQRQAQAIGGQDRPGKIDQEAWDRFAAEVGIKPRFVRRRVLDLAERLSTVAADTAGAVIDQGVPDPTALRILTVIDERIATVRRGLGRGSGAEA